jgi:hypothetical protein
MLLVVPVREAARDQFPRSRIRWVGTAPDRRARANPLYYQLIEKFGHATAFPY